MFSRILSSLSSCRSEISRIRERLSDWPDDKTDVHGAEPHVRRVDESESENIAEIERLKKELSAERQARNEAEQKLSSIEKERQAYREMRLEAQALRIRAEKADELTSKLEEAQERLAVLEPSADPKGELESLRRRERALVIKVERLRRRVSELQRYADENRHLREQIGEQEKLQAQIREFESRVRHLEGQLLKSVSEESHEATPDVVTAVELPPLLTTIPNTISGTVEMELRNLLVSTRSKTAVIADHRGLSLAEAGEPGLSDELAALSSLAQSLAGQGRSLVSLNPVTSVELHDSSREGLFVRFFQVDDESMGLVLYGRRYEKILDKMESSVARLSLILAEQKGENEDKA